MKYVPCEYFDLYTYLMCNIQNLRKLRVIHTWIIIIFMYFILR